MLLENGTGAFWPKLTPKQVRSALKDATPRHFAFATLSSNDLLNLQKLLCQVSSALPHT